ncbi:putative ankyrin repeat protein RF_0381 [Leptopilina heterotoma]|uniref:putative ankyrin repeat protein RF_0381 n=1 Tax=Leptopilina heterotoma TaxID=63436 RepID=UPI001CA9041D|nr:putative ankyrin repeat protein RF_0381 [Leptopilina heterotoma]XP_043472688.1 putative ankyrin repeat protein RF_0381 [Leptopilina heterotoma]
MDIDTVYKSFAKVQKSLYRDITNYLQNKDESLVMKKLQICPQIVLYQDPCTKETLLHHVARFGTPAIAKHILYLFANINAPDIVQRTPLYRAVECNTEMVEFLLNNRARINVVSQGKTLLQHALQYGSIDTVCLILNKMFIQFQIDGNLKLIDNGEKCWKIVEFLLSKEIECSAIKFSILLLFLLRNGSEEIFQETLRNCVFNLDAQCSFGHTLLHWAIQLDKYQHVKCLLDMGADINAEGSCGVSALHHAVRKKNPSLVSYLLSRGANVNKTTRDDKYSPLHYALVVDNDEIIETLLHAGADINAKFGSPLENSSVLNLVCGCSSLRQRLSFSMSNSIDVNSLFSGRNLVFNKERIKFLIEMGADIEVSEESYNGNELTPLQRACEAGRMDIVELLVSYGADVQSRNNDGMTMIHHAVIGMNLDVVEFLLQRGLDINALDHFNRTPLYYLVKLHSNDVIPMIEFLVDNGADVNVYNKKEFSPTAGAGPLHVAVKQEQLNVIECLLHFQADVTALNKHRERPLESSYSYTDFITRRSEILLAFMALNNIEVSIDDEKNDMNNDNDDDDDNDLDADLNEESPATSCNRNMSVFFYRKCQLEIDKMKQKKICNERNITFYEFLVNDLMKVTISARYEQILEILDLNKYQLEFPCYFFLLKKRVERVRNMLQIQDSVICLLENYSKIELPIIIIDKIFENLSARDFRNLGRVLLR